MKASTRIAMSVLAVTAAAGFLSSNAFAETPWQKHHPVRVHDNHRIANQNRRITQEVKEGEMTHAQAHALRADDRKIRQEERDMASQNGSHLTRADQHALNQQLNENSRDIGK
jgi:hypothetical protein